VFRIPLTYEVFHFLTGEALVAAVKIYFTAENPSKEKFKLIAGKYTKPKSVQSVVYTPKYEFFDNEKTTYTYHRNLPTCEKS